MKLVVVVVVSMMLWAGCGGTIEEGSLGPVSWNLPPPPPHPPDSVILGTWEFTAFYEYYLSGPPTDSVYATGTLEVFKDTNATYLPYLSMLRLDNGILDTLEGHNFTKDKMIFWYRKPAAWMVGTVNVGGLVIVFKDMIPNKGTLATKDGYISNGGVVFNEYFLNYFHKLR